MKSQAPDMAAQASTCLSCHGTKVEFIGLEERDTLLGEMDLPRLSGWPNQAWAA